MSKMKFKTETKRLLDLMINSIYTNKEIFLRELISNASDAIDKYHYLSLTNDSLTTTNFEIDLSKNKDLRAIVIKDNGIGMTEDEINNNLGVIAKSGSEEFMKNVEEKMDIIGQFGVGFYSLFMVGKKVIVETKSPFSEKGYKFTSDGLESYTVEECDYNEHGTKITIFLRDNTDEVNYDEYLEDYRIEELVKKYSDYIKYPIKMNVTTSKKKDDSDEYEDIVEEKTLNSMTPLWKKSKSDVTEEELDSFYMQKYGDYEKPLLSINLHVEGNFEYNALLFIPSHAPYNLYSDSYEKGLELYTKGVFIMDKCKNLIPDYLRMVKGLVDSADLNLNISREILQEDGQLLKIAQNIEKKIISELGKLLKNDREKYIKFFKTFGLNLKYGIYEKFGQKKDLLKDLIMFTTTSSDDYKTLDEYVKDMKEDQKYIYYAAGESKNQILTLPQMDQMKKLGYDCLILTDDVDSFMIQILEKYNDKEFKSITDKDLNLMSEEESKEIDSKEKEVKSVLDRIKESLGSKVTDVKLSKKLVDSPVCLSSGEGITFDMEKTMANMPNNPGIKAERILEINPNHQILNKLKDLNENDLKLYSNILFNQALLIEGLPIDDPNEFSKQLAELMSK